MQRFFRCLKKVYQNARSHFFGNDSTILMPKIVDFNIILKDYSEVEVTLKLNQDLKLHLHNDIYKNWDLYHMFSFILNNTGVDSSILDMGCSNYGALLPSLQQYGYKNLYGCDLVIKETLTNSPISLSCQDLHNTNYESGTFDVITSISVIEHGVDIERYFKEASRLLKPGGFLLTTADYWPSPIETKGIVPYPGLGDMKVFTQNDIMQIFHVAEKYELFLTKPMDFSFDKKVVKWDRVNKEFTFIYFVLRKAY